MDVQKLPRGVEECSFFRVGPVMRELGLRLKKTKRGHEGQMAASEKTVELLRRQYRPPADDEKGDRWPSDAAMGVQGNGNQGEEEEGDPMAFPFQKE